MGRELEVCTGQRGRERLPGPSPARPAVLWGIRISSSRLEGCEGAGGRGRDRGCKGEMSRKKRDYETIAVNFMPLFARD